MVFFAAGFVSITWKIKVECGTRTGSATLSNTHVLVCLAAYAKRIQVEVRTGSDYVYEHWKKLQAAGVEPRILAEGLESLRPRISGGPDV